MTRTWVWPGSVGFVFRQLTRIQLVVDLVVAVVFGAIVVPLSYGDGLPGLILVLAMVSALGLRRFSPGLALMIAWVGVIAQLSAGLPATLANAAILAVLYTTGAYAERAARWFGLGSALVGGLLAGYYTAIIIVRGTASDSENTMRTIAVFGTLAAVAAVVVLALSWTIGLLVRTGRRARAEGRQRYLAEREQFAAQQAMFALEERNRIARDMHDVVAHSLAVIIAQSDGARYVHRGNADALAGTLETVAGTARSALTDVRLLLSELRHSQGDGPQPVLSDLGGLIEQMRSTGLEVHYIESGELIPLPTGQQIALYRIVQESLTNALRHGDRARRVLLAFHWRPGALTVQIDNATLPPNPGLAPRSGGHGLPGMQERAALAGGSVAFTPPSAANAYHFVVTVHMPAGAVRPTSS
ncbi:sensor histidine kinase [Mycetocola lacteus]|uniref:histidine kinase n=1 Tax=Mycetocola lacteus TaxID=76637 RepID=A0A3L7AQF4_9MICO|nr:sensor histidine kinase [Mycetocola lacteus]RLP82195.1 sensor histidine kinase [Mycetocola lacteus]